MGSFPSLIRAHLGGNQLKGDLPAMSPGAMPELEVGPPPHYPVNSEARIALKRLSTVSAMLIAAASWRSDHRGVGASGEGDCDTWQVLGLQWNMLHGPVPESWSNLKSMRALWVRPGNYQLCGDTPPAATFSFCKDASGHCESPLHPHNSSLPSTCSHAAIYLPLMCHTHGGL